METRIRLVDLDTTLRAIIESAVTNSPTFSIGDQTGDVSLSFSSSPTVTASIRFNSSTGVFEASSDNSTFYELVLDNDSRLHDQNTDNGTTSNTFSIGDGADTPKTIEFLEGSANSPYIRYDTVTNRILLSNDGVSTISIENETVLFPAEVGNQTGPNSGYQLPGEATIVGTSFPGEVALNIGRDSLIQVQVYTSSPSSSWISGETIVEYRQDPSTKTITLSNQSVDPVEIRVLVNPV